MQRSEVQELHVGRQNILKTLCMLVKMSWRFILQLVSCVCGGESPLVMSHDCCTYLSFETPCCAVFAWCSVQLSAMHSVRLLLDAIWC
jgi:hypothetical protein